MSCVALHFIFENTGLETAITKPITLGGWTWLVALVRVGVLPVSLVAEFLRRAFHLASLLDAQRSRACLWNRNPIDKANVCGGVVLLTTGLISVPTF